MTQRVGQAVPFTLAFSKQWLEQDFPALAEPDHRRLPDARTDIRLAGDEHLFVECRNEMSLEAFFKSLSMARGGQGKPDQGV